MNKDIVVGLDLGDRFSHSCVLDEEGEAPSCPVYIDGEKRATLHGTHAELATAFRAIVDEYVARKYPGKAATAGAARQA